MDSDFDRGIYYGCIIKGDLLGAIKYVKGFSEQSVLYNRFMEIFEREKYTVYEADDEINKILVIYQQYYRDVFYLQIEREEAEDRLRLRLLDFFGNADKSIELSDIEQKQAVEYFEKKGFHFLGGRTSGYYGPYIWRTTEIKTYEVELPDGIQKYAVKLLDGFIAKSWTDYLSFGEIGTGGWTDQDGMINCIKSAYDFNSEEFRVSLLKHEAQHARDLLRNKDMPLEELEYRAKLVELIYTEKRNLFRQFLREADGSDLQNGHSSAAAKILAGYVGKLNLSREELENLANREVQAVAKELFEEAAFF